MKITWLGHACFLVDTAEGSIVFDPYAPGSVPGLKLPPLRADAVCCSHGHRDHVYAEGVTLSGRAPSFTLRQLPCWHDDRRGALRGDNRIALLEAEGLRLAHLGDLGHEPDEELLAQLKGVDVLLIPVGGHYTIDGEQAAAIAGKIGARVVIPMHYRGTGFGYDVIAPPDAFLSRMEQVRRLEDNCLTVTAQTEAGVYLPRCPVGG